MLKKGISVLLIMVLILSTFTIIPFSVSADTFPNVSGFPDFDMDCYVADLFINPDTAQYNHIIFEMNSKSTNKVMRDRIESNTPMMAAMTAWQVATFQASDTSHDAVTQLGYYESIILSSLNTAMKSKPVKDTFDNAYVKGGKMLFDAFKNILKAEYAITDIDLSDYNSLSAAKQTAYMNSFEKAFKQQHPGTSDLGKFTKIFGTIVKTGKATEECINLFSSYYHCSLVDDYLCEVINDMYDQCPDDNATMKTALMNISKACNGSLDKIALDVVYRGFDVIYGTVVDNTINGIIASQPAGLAFMIAQSIGKNVSNFLFSTDAICENYYKICCFDEFEKLVRSVTQYEIDKYKAERTNYNANVLFSAVGLMFEINEISCDISIEYADTIYEKSVAGIFLDKAESDNFKKTVEGIRKIKQETYYLLMTDYIFNLEEDYPEIYASYMKIMDEIKNPVVHVTGVSFSKKHMTLGLDDDTFYFWNNAEVAPANATNRAVSYSSSDDSIVSIKPGNTLMIELHQTGTATITATSEDGGFTDTMTIEVVEGHGADGIHLENPASDIKASGKCGDNVYWNLYNNGLLKIYGNGEMSNFTFDSSPWYKHRYYIKSIFIENGISSIGGYAFWGCTGLTSVTIPDSVTSIGGAAFKNCSRLESLEIPDSVTSIDNGAFWGCTGLTSVTIGNSVSSIGYGAFYNTSWYNNQPDGLVYAGKVAYKMKGDCPFEVVIKDGTLGIADSAFRECAELTSVTIPDSVTSIGDYAFRECTGLTSVTIPDSVTSIGNWAFECCTSLTSITIGNSVTSIGEYAFNACYSLNEVHINDIAAWCMIEINDPISYAKKLYLNDELIIDLVIPDSVTSIGGCAFYGCTSLTSVTIPNSVTSIGEYAFDACSSLTEVTIPDSVTSIGVYAFGYQGGFTIYGYKGSEAERYANDYGFKFINITNEKTDSATGIILTAPYDVEINVENKTGQETDFALPYGVKADAVYDITLTKGGETVQPDNAVTVKIPCQLENAKVFRAEADGTYTDMNAKYTDGYLVFTTDHFSVYIVAEEKSVIKLGDVDGDGAVTVADATVIQRYVTKVDAIAFDEEVADIDGDGIITIVDATFIQRYAINAKTPYKIGEAIA